MKEASTVLSVKAFNAFILSRAPYVVKETGVITPRTRF